MKNVNAQNPIKLSSIDQDVLTALRHRQWLYGLELLEELNHERPKQLGFGSLYPALNRLEKRNLVECRWGEGHEVSGGARRKYYHITGLGMEALLALERYREQLTARASKRLIPDGM